jgi:hypothetical protein
MLETAQQAQETAYGSTLTTKAFDRTNVAVRKVWLRVCSKLFGLSGLAVDWFK